ncbi:MAG: thymidine kinase, partial [Acetivibrio sp.]
MAKLYFRHGAMGSSKTANALMVHYNYYERGKEALLVKPKLENRDGEVVIRSRAGLEQSCEFMEKLQSMDNKTIQSYACIIVDEAQFLKKEQVRFLVHIVDDLGIPVICYGLRTDFRHELFEGSMWL